jgi:hypothetical protein
MACRTTGLVSPGASRDRTKSPVAVSRKQE